MKNADPFIAEQRWNTFETTQNCPVCDHDKFFLRKIVAKKDTPQHWRYTCNVCKCQWFKPWQEHVNTHEQA